MPNNAIRPLTVRDYPCVSRYCDAIWCSISKFSFNCTRLWGRNYKAFALLLLALLPALSFAYVGNGSRLLNVNLSDLTISAGTITPAFSSSTTSYTASVVNTVSSVTVTPTAVNERAKITVNGVSVSSGTASGAIALSIGQNTITTVVSSLNGFAKKTYTITVTRVASTNDNLSSLAISQGAISPVFASNTTSYASSVVIAKKEHTVYTMGDSITAFGEYQTTLDSLLKELFTFVNLGIAGDHTTDMANRFPVVVNAVPDYVIILGGVNDILDADAGGAKAIENNLQTMYTQAHNAGVKVIALTVTPNKGYKAWTATTQAVQDSVNAWIPTALNVNYVVNTFTLLQDPANADQLLAAYDSGDHLHPNQAGESKMAQAIYTAANITPNPAVDATNAANTSVAVTPVTSDATATVTVNGAAVTSGTASTAIQLTVSTNSIPTKVTAQSGAVKMYTLNVTGAPSTNASLAYLSLSNGGLSFKPAFAVGTTTYTTWVDHDTTSVEVKPSTTDAFATVTVNGVAVTSGAYSAPISLSVGVNTITVVVTAQDGVTKSTSTVSLTRLPVNLANITLSSGQVSPAFSSTVTSYTASVAYPITSITVTPTAADAGTTITVNGTAVTSGAASAAIPLTVGANKITVTVTGSDGATTYTITETRLQSTNANLELMKPSSGTLTPQFSSATTSYTSSVPYSISAITITPNTGDPNATVTVNGTSVALNTASGAIALAVGTNTINTVVTAPDGVTQKTYTLTETRAAASTNDNLSGLAVSQGTLSPAFATGTASYNDMVTNGTTSVTVTPTLQDATATVTVNGTAVTSGNASGPIALVVGSNTVNIVVTAQDGVTTHTYTVNVLRPSTNDKLVLLKISAGTLTPVFNENTFAYTASVTNATTSITVTPTGVVTTSTITVNGAAVVSGSASGAINLSIGANTINTTVTAQDGVTTDTYTITVTRAAAADNAAYEPVSVAEPVEHPNLDDDVLVVHQGISPNGDGVNDFLVIDGILAYPDNHLAIMNRNGLLIYEAKGYDNSTRVFDGHSNKNGQMQLPGTYFYELDYTANGIVKHKTGYLVLKY